MRAPMFSIVVPVYNAGKDFLIRCFDSINSQTIEDFEVLVVDDGSTDDSGKICDEYAMTHPKFRVFHKANGRVASARNYALDRAEGEWVTFIDNDDWLAPNTLEKLKENNRDDVDIMIFDTKALFPDGHEETYKTLPYENLTILDEEKRTDFLLDLIAEGYAKTIAAHGIMAVWDKAYRRSTLKKLHIRALEDLTIADDLMFTITCVRQIPGKILYLEDPLYCRYMNPTSDSNSYHPEIVENDRKFLSHLQAVLDDRMTEPEIKAALQKRYTICLLGLLSYDMCHRNNPKDKKTRIFEMKQLASQEPYRTALHTCNLKWLRKKRQLYVVLLRMHMYGMLFRLMSR